jgi:hypothetical protein
MKFSSIKFMTIAYKISFAVILIALLTNCTQSSQQFEYVRTNQLPELEFKHVITIQDTDTVTFNSVSAVLSDEDQNIFIADQAALSVYIFNSDGEYLQTLGGEGSGPGEFRSILSMFMDSNFNLYVNDIVLNKTSVFAKVDDKWIHTQEFSTGSHRYSVIAASDNGDVALRKSPPQTPTVGAYWYEHELGFGNLHTEEVEPNRHRFKERGQLVNESGSMNGIPYGRMTLLTTDLNGQLYLLCNETFEVNVFDININPIDTIQVNLPNFEISTEERNDAINRLPNIHQGLAEQYIPSTKPVARQLVVDYTGRLWVRTYDSPEYLIIDTSGKAIASFDLQDTETLMSVSENQFFTRFIDENGTKIFVYDINL